MLNFIVIVLHSGFYKVTIADDLVGVEVGATIFKGYIGKLKYKLPTSNISIAIGFKAVLLEVASFPCHFLCLFLDINFPHSRLPLNYPPVFRFVPLLPIFPVEIALLKA